MDLGKAGRAVEAALAASTRGRPTAFAVLSGAEEARLEFRAVNAALPGVGVLAGGGKSLQVASSLEDAASLDLDSFAGHERVKKHVPRRRPGLVSSTDWRNGSASDSSPEGYAFESRIGHLRLLQKRRGRGTRTPWAGESCLLAARRSPAK